MTEKKETKGSDVVTMIAIIIGTILFFYLRFVGRAIIRKKTWSFDFLLISLCYLLFLVSGIYSPTWSIPLALFRLFPNCFSFAHINWVYTHIKEPYLTLILFLIPTTLYLFVIGLVDWIKFKRVQNAIDHLGLKTSTGLTPFVKAVFQGENAQKKILLQATGIDVNELKAKKGNLESSLNAIVQEIRVSSTNRQVFEILIAEKELSNLVHFQELAEKLTRPFTFLVGESLDGLVIGDLCEVHHVIVAGATGGGKSVFFKQMLVGLLKSSKYIQLYLIDLKRGVEMKTFESLENVRIVKETPDAIVILQSIVDEMEKRFLFLEKNNLTEILPSRDKMDRIVIGIDEASVLFTIEKHSKLAKENAEIARELTDKIAKLGRAAAINLILATQKVVKETIDTRVQTNINARMVFRLNTVASSMTVLGNKKAAELPLVKGRAIWSVGSQDLTVQVPLLTTDEMNEEINLLQSKFSEDKKNTFGPMITIKKVMHKNKVGFSSEKSKEALEVVQGDT
jgi:hypothetical protein